jgi:hypothetical protein
VQLFSDVIGYKETVMDACEIRVWRGGFIVQMVIELFVVGAQTGRQRMVNELGRGHCFVIEDNTGPPEWFGTGTNQPCTMARRIPPTSSCPDWYVDWIAAGSLGRVGVSTREANVGIPLGLVRVRTW